ncbi:MAG TPA: proline dehydrogenase [bacterium]|nr:proline dehydrogenase [bacterium]
MIALRRMLRACWVPLAARAARGYVAGPDLEDALQICRRLSQQGVAGTVCYWNGDGDSPRAITDEYLGALAGLARERLNCSLSVKAPPLGFARDLFAEILEVARRGGLTVHFDSLAPETCDATFALIAESRARHPRLGCTLPGRWRRSIRDADLAVDLRLGVRVVKGQWADPGVPDLDMRAGFLAVIDRLAGRAPQVGVATHDPELAREALRRLRGAGTPCELEQLLGLPAGPSLREAAAAGVPVRFYVPYGLAYLPYALSKAMHNPRMVWWVVRDLARGGGALLPNGAPAGGGPVAGRPRDVRCERL